MKVLIVLIPWVKAWHIHLFISLNKLRDNKASEIDIFTNKLDNSDNTTILWAFLLILIFNQSYHQTLSWRANIYISFRYPFFLSHLSCFSLLHDKHFETNEKNYNRIDESITVHRRVWCVGWIHFLFSSLLSLEKTAFDLLAFCSLQHD